MVKIHDGSAIFFPMNHLHEQPVVIFIIVRLINRPDRHFKRFKIGPLGNLKVIYGSVSGKQVRAAGSHSY